MHATIHEGGGGGGFVIPSTAEEKYNRAGLQRNLSSQSNQTSAVRRTRWVAERPKNHKAMTAKEYVRETYPRARCVRYKRNGGGGYNFVWADWREEKRLSEGKSADEAWRNARDRVKASSATARTEPRD